MPFPIYDIATETSAGTTDPTRLDRQIRLSTISAPGLALFQGLTSNETNVTTMFSSPPTAPDQAIVTAVVAAHDGTVVAESGFPIISFTHSNEHPLLVAPSVPAWDLIENEDPNERYFLYPNNGNEVLVFSGGLYRIRYAATAITTKDYALIRANVESSEGVTFDGLDAEIVLRDTGSDRGVVGALHDVRLDANVSVSPYFSSDEDSGSDLVQHSASWSIQFLTSRG